MDPLLVVVVTRATERLPHPYVFEARMIGVFARFRGVGATAAEAIADLFTSAAALEARKWEEAQMEAAH